MPTTESLSTQLDRLASFDGGAFPVISLYLDLRPNEHGRDQFEPFLKKELSERVRTYAATGPERDSLEKDAAKIRDYVSEIDRSTNGLAIFACSGADLFGVIRLAAPVDAHRLYVDHQPHLYPLAKILDEYPRYVALITDTNSARIFVFATNEMVRSERIDSTKTKQHKKGGWSQARYRRHIENYHLQHAKEVVDAVAKIVRDEGIGKVVVSGDDVIVPLLREQLPKDVSDRIIDMRKLDIRTPEHEILAATMQVLHEKDATTDRERVDALIGAYRAGGLATVGVDGVRKAFELGQVDELVITAKPAADPADDELVGLARKTSAATRFIEDASLLESVRGVGAFLRFKV